MAVALFGGTFDPIHNGHLAAARAATASGLVDEVVFIPAGQPPHKPLGPSVSAEERWCMTVLATLPESAWRVARWEIDRAGPSYAVDTLRHAHEALRKPDGSAPELYWVIGTDAMADIGKWHQVESLFQLTRFLVIARHGFDEPGLRAHLQASVPWAPREAVTFLQMPHVDVSATALRRRLAAGSDVSDTLHPMVSLYIQRYGLYRQGTP